MKLYTNCATCHQPIDFRVAAKDRFVLAQKRGKRVELKCPYCNCEAKYHVNDIKAEADRRISIVSTLILLLGTTATFVWILPMLFDLIDIYTISGVIGVITVPFMFYQAINSGQEESVRYFNRIQYE